MKLSYDSSVLAKIFIDEEGSELAKEMIFSMAELGFAPFASELVVYEIGNILHNRQPRNPLNRTHLEELHETGIIFQRMSAEDAVETMILADEEKLTYYDAAHLFLARKAGSVLVTEDNALLRKAGCVSLSQAAKNIDRFKRFSES